MSRFCGYLVNQNGGWLGLQCGEKIKCVGPKTFFKPARVPDRKTGGQTDGRCMLEIWRAAVRWIMLLAVQ